MSISKQRSTRWLPRSAALAAAFVGAVNVGSALTPSIRWRGHLLLSFEPVETMRLFHALALPAGAALMLVAPYLAKRRRRAWELAIVLMLALGLFDLLKGLDFEETAITWATAAVLLVGGGAFRVRHDPITLRSAGWRVPLLGLGGLAVAAIAIWASQDHPSLRLVAHETADLLRWRPGPLAFHAHVAFDHRFAWIPLSVHLIEVGTLLSIAYVVFRPVAASRGLPGPAAREAAAKLVRAYGTDTLSFFKLRADKHYLFSGDERAFVGYRLPRGSRNPQGSPVGEPPVKGGIHHRAPRAWRSRRRRDRAVEGVLERGRHGAPERGFSMAMDSITGPDADDTLVVLARDEDGAIRGVLHFVPCYGREAVSLSFMRRDPGTPNGLMEFLVVGATGLLRDRGLAEMSLNFAAFAKWIHSPEKRWERLLGRLMVLGNPFFQIESLYRFNAKFFPRWEPRYLVYDGAFGLPRAGIAALWAEGQLWKPSRPRVTVSPAR